MNLTVRLFATLKDRVGASATTIDVEEPALVADVLAALTQKYPAIEPSLGALLVAANQEYAQRTQAVHPGDDIALFPPVSGG